MNSNVSPNNRMQPDFGELALPSAADARRYAAKTWILEREYDCGFNNNQPGKVRRESTCTLVFVTTPPPPVMPQLS